MYRLQRMFNERGFLCYKLRSERVLNIEATLSERKFFPRLFVWKLCLVKWFLMEVILKVCMWLKIFNVFCNFLLKASNSLLTDEEADKSNWCGAHIAVTLILLLLNAKSENKDLNLSHFYLYFEFDHIQLPDCGNHCFRMGNRCRETS
jgi:hypothetical protein